MTPIQSRTWFVMTLTCRKCETPVMTWEDGMPDEFEIMRALERHVRISHGEPVKETR